MCLCAIWAWLVFVVDGKHKLPPIYPGHLPIIGHLHLLIGDGVYLWNFAKVVAMKAMERGGVLVLIMGYRIYYAITDPEDALTAANACLQKHFTYDYAKPWLGEGLITSSVTAFGFSTGFEDKQFIQKYMRAVDEILNIVTRRFQKFWLQSQLIFKLCGYQKRQDELVKIVNDMSDKTFIDIVFSIHSFDRRLNAIAWGRNFSVWVVVTIVLATNLAKFNMVLDLGKMSKSYQLAPLLFLQSFWSILLKRWLEAGARGDTDEEGGETQRFCIHLRINQVFPTDRDVDKDDLQKLVYTEAVIKESLRVFTTGPVTLRYVDKDVKLKNYTMRAGSQCIILLFGAHRDPVWGKDVAEFRPERWLDPDTPVNPGAFIGFSLGKRSCLGRTYAMISMKTTLVHFLRTYKVSADDSNLKLKVDFLLKPVSGHEITIEQRT
ncbi:hypothetical protein HF086_011301 [Spodoptera exigua]|uniref:Cytochrome p450 n=1 Tax=Spodoptera exigua TaxID=7107 RepID=A0A922MFR4_SPOEX|nr:hypothetical protein HF086_011301 [Spodoptera exigua]